MFVATTYLNTVPLSLLCKAYTGHSQVATQSSLQQYTEFRRSDVQHYCAYQRNTSGPVWEFPMGQFLDISVTPSCWERSEVFRLWITLQPLRNGGPMTPDYAERISNRYLYECLSRRIPISFSLVFPAVIAVVALICHFGALRLDSKVLFKMVPMRWRHADCRRVGSSPPPPLQVASFLSSGVCFSARLSSCPSSLSVVRTESCGGKRQVPQAFVFY